LLLNVRALIFDLDGTLSDPSLGIERSLNHSLAAHGYPEIPAEQVATVIGPPLDEVFVRFSPEADQAVISSLVASYRERYVDVGYAENSIYPGVADTLQELSSAGVRMGVCTSKRKDIAEKILALFELSAHFHFVSGGDVGIKKREQLADLLQTTDIDHSAIMIGDRAVDIASAKHNGLRSAGVLWGFGDLDELESAGADVILKTTSELLKLGL